MQPRSVDELRALYDVKPWWTEHFGAELLRVLREAGGARAGRRRAARAGARAAAHRASRQLGQLGRRSAPVEGAAAPQALARPAPRLAGRPPPQLQPASSLSCDRAGEV